MLLKGSVEREIVLKVMKILRKEYSQNISFFKHCFSRNRKDAMVSIEKKNSLKEHIFESCVRLHIPEKESEVFANYCVTRKEII